MRMIALFFHWRFLEDPTSIKSEDCIVDDHSPEAPFGRGTSQFRNVNAAL